MDQLLDNQAIEREYTVASKKQRFINYLIDVIAFYFLAFLIGLIAAVFIIGTGNEEMILEEPEESLVTKLRDYLLGSVLVLFYYFVFEYLTKGKTLGKYFTRTRSVTMDNRRMGFSTTLKRSLCRLIPFEAFSFLGDEPTGWHDTMTNTKVIIDENWEDYYV
ncbi:MAG: RDD family protein [Bacteroidota bacterium]